MLQAGRCNGTCSTPRHVPRTSQGQYIEPRARSPIRHRFQRPFFLLPCPRTSQYARVIIHARQTYLPVLLLANEAQELDAQDPSILVNILRSKPTGRSLISYFVIKSLEEVFNEFQLNYSRLVAEFASEGITKIGQCIACKCRLVLGKGIRRGGIEVSGKRKLIPLA